MSGIGVEWVFQFFCCFNVPWFLLTIRNNASHLFKFISLVYSFSFLQHASRFYLLIIFVFPLRTGRIVLSFLMVLLLLKLTRFWFWTTLFQFFWQVIVLTICPAAWSYHYHHLPKPIMMLMWKVMRRREIMINFAWLLVSWSAMQAWPDP